MSDEAMNTERLISSRAEAPSPSPDFEKRLFAALERKQQELGRVPATPFKPEPDPAPRGGRIPLLALTGLAAACVCAIYLGEQVAPEAPVPPVPSKIQTTAERPLVGPTMPNLPSVPIEVAQPDSSTTPAPPAPPPSVPVDELVTASEPLRRTLQDGSVVFLDKGAQAVLGARSVKLLSGRGFVEVAPTKPGMSDFTVVTDSAKAVAHGTKFAFDLTGAGLGIAVAQGTVELANERGTTLVRAGEVGRSSKDEAPAFESAKRLSFLCSWMDEVYARRAEKRIRNSLGRLVALDPYGQEFQLSVRNVQVDVHIEDGVA
ncbi:MAG: FecR domain-containing protein, partial [Planctomycetota bacterium]